MFWHSVSEAFGFLGFWQVWAAIFFFTGAMFVSNGFLSLTVRRGDVSWAGCLALIVKGVLHTILTATVVAYLLPLMLGAHKGLPISHLSRQFGTIAMAGLNALLVSLGIVGLLSLIPVVGKVLSESPPFQIVIIGSIVFRELSWPVVQEMAQKTGQVAHSLYPGFWLGLGYIGVALLVYYLGAAVVAVLVAWLEEPVANAVAIVAVSVLQVLTGLVGVFMYSGYVRNRLLTMPLEVSWLGRVL